MNFIRVLLSLSLSQVDERFFWNKVMLADLIEENDTVGHSYTPGILAN